MRYVFFIFVFLFNIRAIIFSQSIKLGEIKSDIQKDIVIIYYNIKNTEGYTLQIDLLLKKKNDPSFKYQPKYVNGDVGEGNFNGQNRIIWNINKEKMPIINFDDYYFDLDIKVISKGSNKWLWIGAGTAILAGGTTLYFLLKKDKKETIQTESIMPQPPGRP